MKFFLSLCLLLFLAACSHTPVTTVDERSGVICLWGKQQFNLCQYDNQQEMVEALLAEMTLDEKIGQMTQSVWHNGVNPRIVRRRGIGSIIQTEGPVPGPTPHDWMDKFDQFQRQAMRTRLGIPLLIAVDAVHGQNTFEGAVIFPHNIGMAASRNMSLIQQAAEITAIEAAGTGFNWTFSPCIAMPQHEHWGRVYEGFTEDRETTIAATRASVRGHQGNSLADRHTIAATAKHYIGDGATTGGVEGGDAELSEQLIREEYLPPYQAAVEENVAAIMVGFNSVNGINMHQHKELVGDLLKDELGFKGVVLTDWNGGQRFGPAHTVINAGVDLAMQPGNHEEFMADLRGSILDGTVKMDRIDDAVRRLLTLKFKLGLFTDPFAKREFAEEVGSDKHREVARQAVRESLVLLKNDNQALPLDTSKPIAVVGEHANNSGLQSGGWSIHWQGQTHSYAGATTILGGIQQVAGSVEYAAEGCNGDMQADTAVVVVGEQPYAEGFGDTDELWLSDDHKQMIAGCKSLGKKIVVILISGRVLAIKLELDSSDAFIAAWLPGSEGAGIADLLYSIDGFKPKGKSPYAWPVEAADFPLESYDERALFQYGYGLSDF
ncbi:MAG: glycoside hydrolase family 3 N-terminal domain-containing protein [Pseudomonadota bacterium]